MIELSRKGGALDPSETEIESVLERAVRTVKSHLEYRLRIIELYSSGSHESWLDAKVLDRAFYNVVLHAAEATTANESGGSVRISVKTNASLAIRAADDGLGTPDAIRDKIFDPFVGFGKERGTALGLTIAQTILRDQSGYLILEKMAPVLTVFLATLPVTGITDPELCRVPVKPARLPNNRRQQLRVPHR